MHTNLSLLIVDFLKNNLPSDASTKNIVINDDIGGFNDIYITDGAENGDKLTIFVHSNNASTLLNTLDKAPLGSYVVFISQQPILSHRSYLSGKLLYNKYSVNTLFLEPAGKLSHVVVAGKKISIPLGSKIPNTALSPYCFGIFHKTNSPYKRYLSKSRLYTRISRVTERLVYKLKNSKANDIYNTLSRTVRACLPVSRRLIEDKTNFIVKGIHQPKGGPTILIATGQLAVGGVERVLLNIVSALPKDYRIILCTTLWNSNDWHDTFLRHCDNVVLIPDLFGHGYPPIYHTALLKNLLKSIQPDIYFITNSTAGYESLTCKPNKTRAVDLLHTYGLPSEKDAFLRVSSPYDKYLSVRVVISQFLKKYLLDNYDIESSKVRVIYNGVKDLDDDHIGSVDLPGQPDTKYITYIGRLQEDKSPDRLVSLAYRARSILEKYNAKILVVGDGNMRSELESQARQLGILGSRIAFLGYHKSIPSILKSSHYTLIVSNLEGVPMSVLESMQLGVPVISTAVGGIPEVINSSNGYLVKLNDKSIIDDLAKNLGQALALTNEEYKNMQYNCIKTIEDKFSSMEDTYNDLFESLVN